MHYVCPKCDAIYVNKPESQLICGIEGCGGILEAYKLDEDLEADFLKSAYICKKCQSLHMSSDNLEGKTCSIECDGFLKKVDSAEEFIKSFKKEKNES